MKASTLTAALLALLMVAHPGTAGAQTYGYGDVDVSVEVFYDTLSPYGEWVEVDHYGYVWRPYASVVGLGFRPYVTNGRWIYTEYGWSFESDFAWGWAPFHYGRWYLDSYYGWLWIPGTTWAPAWVDWRFGNGYVGWTPLPPPGITIVERHGPTWCFVETRYFVHPRFYEHVVPSSRVSIVFRNTYVVREQVTYGGSSWYSGPPPVHVASAVGAPIRPVPVRPPEPGAVRPVHIASPVGAAQPPPAQGHSGHGASAPQYGSPPPSFTRPPTGFGRHTGWSAPGHTSGPVGHPPPGRNEVRAPPPGGMHGSAPVHQGPAFRSHTPPPANGAPPPHAGGGLHGATPPAPPSAGTHGATPPPPPSGGFRGGAPPPPSGGGGRPPGH